LLTIGACVGHVV